MREPSRVQLYYIDLRLFNLQKEKKIPKVTIPKSSKTTDETPTKNDDLGFEINFDGYQKTKKKPKVKFSKTKVPTDFQEGVSKLFDTEGALITVVEKTRKKSESSKQFWELIKDRGLKRPGMHSKYC